MKMETIFNTFEVLITFLHRSKGYYKHHQEQIKLSKSIVCRFLEAGSGNKERFSVPITFRMKIKFLKFNEVPNLVPQVTVFLLRSLLDHFLIRYYIDMKEINVCVLNGI